ncbi:MAG: right-handed parallel beta-helix repeat-containing protein [Armatimonadota bacterium]|nr:right-handed parallel beta-helix repeat-containing protein [Armatimonadota bacterium]
MFSVEKPVVRKSKKPLSYSVLLWPLCGMTLLLGLISPAQATTFTVTTTADPGTGACTAAGNGDGCTLREAIAAANAVTDDDTISFASGVTGTINLTTALPALSTHMTIQGPGAGSLAVRGEGATDPYRIFTIAADQTVTISGLTITNGYTTGNGAVGTTGHLGGGILNDGGTLTLSNCTLSQNTATGQFGGFGGAIVNNVFDHSSATLTLTNCTLINNSAKAGGGIANAGTVTINNSTISHNTVSREQPGFAGAAASGTMAH